MNSSSEDTNPTADGKEPGRRLFFALRISEDLRAGIAEFSGRLQKAAHFTPVRPRWVPPENMHVTLHFLGPVPEGTIALLEDGLPSAVADCPPFALRVQRIGYFPNSRNPKVLWVGFERTPAELLRARDALGVLINNAGLEVQHQDFHGHITLARFPSLRGTRAFSKVAQTYQDWDCGSDEIKSVHLMESLFDKETGVHYRSIAEAPLRGEGPASA